jgi:carbon monoxide dehydrogenase subunit G
MSIDVTTSTTIRRPVAEVAAYAMDVERERDWIAGIKESKKITPGPLSKGTQVERVAYFMGKRVDYILEIIDYQPGRMLDMQSVKAPFPMRVTYAFEPASDGTRASIRIRGGMTGLIAWLTRPMISMMVRRNIAKDIKRLKANLESNTGK